MQIIPIRDMRDTNALSERCRNSREPIFITKNGKTVAKLITAKVDKVAAAKGVNLGACFNKA